MSGEKKQPTRRSVKKQTEKARAKKAQKVQAEEKRQSKKGNLPLEKAIVSNPAAEKPKARGGRKTKGDTNTKLRWPQLLLVTLIVVLLALAGIFAWDRWLRYDDAKDIQGEWMFTFDESSVPVSINSDRIAFSSDVKFPYKMNSWGKTIEFSFTDLSGEGVYRFSLDRQTLYITEDEQEDIITSIQVSLGLKEPSEGLDLSKTTVLTKQNSSPGDIDSYGEE